ncbi:MAG: Gfo/Idh/MocA family oxidoreductase, partial [Limisphaerales bacterium]
MAEEIKVGLITNADGAHVSAYLSALAATDACSSVVLADSDDAYNERARKALGGKLTATYRLASEMLAKEKPVMTMVSLEARFAPPAIEEVLEAGSHVFAEKPSCIEAADFAPLVMKAESKHLNLMLALANRL